MLSKRLKYILDHKGFKRYLKNTGWLMFGRIGGMVISFFVTAYVLRYLGPDNYGILSFAVSFTGLFSFLASMGIDSILYRDLVDQPENQYVLLGTAFGLKITGGLLAILVMLFWLPFMHNTLLTNELIILISLSFLFQSFNIFQYFFQAKLISRNITLIYLIAVIILSLLKISVASFRGSLIFFGFILLLEPILYGLGYMYVYKQYKYLITSWRFDLKVAKKMIYSSWPLVFSSAFALIYSRIDQVMIKQMLDYKSVGYYDAAVRIAEIWYFIPSIIISSVFPAIVNAKKYGQAQYLNRIKKLALYVFVGSFVAAIPIFLFAPLVVEVLYGAAFFPAVGVLRLYVWSGLGVALGMVMNNYLIIEDRTQVSFYINLLAMIINVVLNIYFIPSMGIQGAAMATLVSYLTIPIFGLLLNNKYYIWKKTTFNQ